MKPSPSSAKNDDRSLLSNDALLRSDTVANCQMNRERGLLGANGYARELGFNPLDKLREVIANSNRVAWLDLCCGHGSALIEAANTAQLEGWGDAVQVVGVDLVGREQRGDELPLQLLRAALPDWEPERRFDLITCVHGLHYIGDKLKVIAKAASWLTENGHFCALLDLSNIQLRGNSHATRAVAKELRQQGLAFDTRKKRLMCDGRRLIDWPWRYLGADDRAGPNYSGQPAVDSFYEREN